MSKPGLAYIFLLLLLSSFLADKKRACLFGSGPLVRLILSRDLSRNLGLVVLVDNRGDATGNTLAHWDVEELYTVLSYCI